MYRRLASPEDGPNLTGGRTDTSRAVLEVQLLARVGEFMVSSLDSEATLTAIVRLLVPSVADWAYLHLVDVNGEIDRVEVAHRDPAKSALAHKLKVVQNISALKESDHPAARAYYTGRSVLVSNVSDDFLVRSSLTPTELTIMRMAAARSYLAVPLLARGRVLGVMTWVVTRESMRSYALADQVMAEAVGARAAMAMDLVRVRAATKSLEEASNKRNQDPSLSTLATQSAGVGAWDWNIKTRALSWSAEFAHLLGIDAEEEPSYTRFLSCVHPDDRAQVDTLARRDKASSEIQLECRILHPKRGVRWVSFVGRELRNPRGESVRTSGIALDVTDRHAYEERLAEMDRCKDEFLAILGHELRNPIAALTLAVSEFEASIDDSRKNINTILGRQTKQLGRLVNDLLDVTRVNRGTIDLQCEYVDLRDVINSALDSVRDTCANAKHNLSIKLPSSAMHAHVDPLRMEQVFVNLLSNAIKYTAPGGFIEIVGRVVAKRLSISITDNGVGMSPHMMETAFNLFSQEKSTRARSKNGLGVGLTIAKRLVDLHGGTLAVHSDGINKGSRFVVNLPRTSTFVPEQPPQAANEDQPQTHAPLKVLVVDDNLDAAELLARVLKRRNYVVEEAYDGKSAVEHARTFQPHVVLLDIGLPEMDGYEVARAIHTEVAPKALLVALTGYGQTDDVERAREAGFSYHILKPADMQTLQHILIQAEKTFSAQNED